MNQQKLSKLSDEELLTLRRKMKSDSMNNALLVGAMGGIVIYSIVNKSVGFLTLIPLVFAYKLIKDSKKHKALWKVLKDRNLDR